MNDERYTTIAERKGKQIYIPDILLRAADIEEGDLVEITIRKVKRKEQ